MNKSILEEIRESGFSADWLMENVPELEILKGVPQNPEYHGEGDVDTHTELVCNSMISLPEWMSLPDELKEIMFLAGAFHDIGKPSCTRMEEGRLTSPRHTIVGERIFRAMPYRNQERFGLPFGQRELVSKLIRYHGLPIWFWSKKQPEQGLLKAAESIPLYLLYLLAKADSMGKICRDPGRLVENLELFAACAEEQGIWKHPYPFANPYTRYQYFHKEGVWQGDELYDCTKFDVLMMSGLPLSGKDSWIERHGGGRSVVSLDDIRAEYNISPSGGSAKVAGIAIERAKVLLRKKQSFIWNATNLSEERRQKLCRLFSSYGARVRIIYLEAPYRELLSRNQKRERHIPEAVLENMIDKLEVPAPWEGYGVEIGDR